MVSQTYWPFEALVPKEIPQMPNRQVAFPPPLEAVMPLKAPPLNDSEMLEKVPPEALPVNVNDPDKVDPELPVSFSLEKLLCESANEGRDKSSMNAHAAATTLQFLLIELLHLQHA
jgi:hypothetical protein